MRFLIFCCFLISFQAFSQDDILAREYFNNGEFEKALATYQKLYQKNKSSNNLLQLVKTHQQLEAYDIAEELLVTHMSRVKFPALFVELGYNYHLKNDVENANLNYNIAISSIDENPNYAFSVAKYFEDHSLLDQAILTYEKASELKPELNFNIQLARIYGDQGNVEKMFESYINFVETNSSQLSIIKRAFNEFVSENSANENNIILRKILLTKIQKEPNLLWNEMLSWLFIQQKDYKKAFVQEKAIFNRNPESLDRIEELALIALNQDAIEVAKEIFNFIVTTTQDVDRQLEAHYYLLQLEAKESSKNTIKEVTEKYHTLFETHGKFSQTLKLQIAYAHFMAFNMHNPVEASLFLKETLKLPLSQMQTAQVKLELGDILVLQEKFNEALIYYTQIQRNIKNSTLSQEARFRVARTSYFKGDFQWAESQLKILKSSTSQLIANDALDLKLLISDNKAEDSLQIALGMYAKADLYAFQNKTDDAIALLSQILEAFKTETIIDQALLKQAQLFESKKQFEKAEANYIAIITDFKDDILADDAHYALAELYMNHLAQPEKAKDLYEQIIFNYQDSIYFVESRKKFRALRGDAIN